MRRHSRYRQAGRGDVVETLNVQREAGEARRRRARIDFHIAAGQDGLAGLTGDAGLRIRARLEQNALHFIDAEDGTLAHLDAVAADASLSLIPSA